ncbi:MAG: hypothetical protein ACMXYL_00870 [Candidatus Woesearchaeota archaeon]
MKEENNDAEKSMDEKEPDITKDNDRKMDLRLFSIIVIGLVIIVSVSFLIFGVNNIIDDNDYVPYGLYMFKAQNDIYTLEYQWMNNIYDINFKYHPDNVTDIPINGPWIDLNRTVYIAFDPYMSERSLAYTRAATLDLMQKLTLIFGRNVQIVCTDNTHPDCVDYEPVTCDTHDSAIVFYESETPRIVLKGSCYEIHGFEEDIFRAEHLLVFVMLNIVRE